MFAREDDGTGQSCLVCDYFVIGAGAMAMAFVDTILTTDDGNDNESDGAGATFIMVDKRENPGGHWNDSYEFVSLHQPALYYGVPSERLERDPSQPFEVTTGRDVCAYYGRVMAKFRASGRVLFFGGCEHPSDVGERGLQQQQQQHEQKKQQQQQGTHNEYWKSSDNGMFRVSFVRLKDGTVHNVWVRRKRVDSTFMRVEVPSTRWPPPGYVVGPTVRLVPVNGLTDVQSQHSLRPEQDYVVIGAGKTGIDAVLHLLRSGIPAGSIRWIISADSWWLNRDDLDPRSSALTFRRWLASAQTKSGSGTLTLEEFFLRMERNGGMMRLDRGVWPTKFRCATVSPTELEELRRVVEAGGIVRQGRVRELQKGSTTTTTYRPWGGDVDVDVVSVVMQHGEPLVASARDTLFVDCTANGLAAREPVPLFQGRTIVLQSVFMCQQVFSAALLGHVECTYGNGSRRRRRHGPPPPSSSRKNGSGPTESATPPVASWDPVHDEEKNRLLIPCPHPEWNRDYVRAILLFFRNVIGLYYGNGGVDVDGNHYSSSSTAQWFDQCRLNDASHTSLYTWVRLVASAHGYLLDAADGFEGLGQLYEQEFGSVPPFSLFPGDTVLGETPRRWARKLRTTAAVAMTIIVGMVLLFSLVPARIIN